MKTLTLNVDDRLYDDLNRYVDKAQLIELLQNHIQCVKKTTAIEKEASSALRSNRKSQILAFSGCWANEEDEDDFSTEAIIPRRQASSRDRHL